jgi:CelD/BcsL family acetyltransferase involved in cellulose biosynthesis
LKCLIACEQFLLDAQFDVPSKKDGRNERSNGSSVSLRLVLHREIPQDPLLRGQWNDLVAEMERPEVFYTWEWAFAMQSAYRANLTPLLFLAYAGDDLVGVASLATDSKNTISFLAATTGDYCDFLSTLGRRAEFVEAIFAELGKAKVRSLKLANLPEDSNTPDILRHAARAHHSHSYMRPAYLCSQVILGTGKEREELRSALAGKKKLRRYLREMERDGPVTFAHLRSWPEIEKALPGFAAAHVARFQATERTSSLATSERRHFLEELARRFSDTGVVTLSLLSIGGQPVAWNYGFQFRGSWFWYQPTFDSRQEENSPGYCLLARIVMEACDREEMNRVDLGLGAEGYKERFGNSTRQTLYVTVTKSWSRHLLEILRYRASSALNRFPKFESALRGLVNKGKRVFRRQP